MPRVAAASGRIIATLRASRLYAMVRERGYSGASDHFRALVARLRPRPAAEAYLGFLYSPEGRAIIAKHHYRPWGESPPTPAPLLLCSSLSLPPASR